MTRAEILAGIDQVARTHVGFDGRLEESQRLQEDLGLDSIRLLVLAAEVLLATSVYLFCTEFDPVATVYGSLQAAFFYMVLAMAFSVLFKSEAAGALVTAAALVAAFPFQAGNTRLSPFWNPLNLTDADPVNVLAWTVQNRIGFALVCAALIALAFGRAENREKLLGG